MRVPAPLDISLLIMDGNAYVREGLTAAFARQSDMHVCAEARDGGEAVELYRRHRPDVAIMDLETPHMGGVAAIRTIRAEFPSACIVALTSNYADNINTALEAGAQAHLLKDAHHRDLLAIVRTLGRSCRAPYPV